MQIEVRSRREYQVVVSSPEMRNAMRLERYLAGRGWRASFSVPGICRVCDETVEFQVDRRFGARRIDGVWIPNWRERMACPRCKLNNRQRAIAHTMRQALDRTDREASVYLMEQVTPMFRFAARALHRHRVVGSEYLGHDVPAGTVVKGIRHEDVELLSFVDDSFDLIVSNDVFEHVPDPVQGFTEVARVLRRGGQFLMTIPFHPAADRTVARARLRGRRVEHLLPAEYHGNPISPAGSLVFSDFGWDVLELLADAGLEDPRLVLYWSFEYGHLGGVQSYLAAAG